ncbi:MAG: cystathionine gamma-lyase [Pseudomonadota bacterium]
MLPDHIREAVHRLLHQRTDRIATGEPVAEPLVATSSFKIDDQYSPDALYARYATPTVQATEAKLALIEDAPTRLFASGMAAISAVMLATLKAGDRVLVPSDGYFHTRIVADDILGPLGIETVTAPTLEFPRTDLTGLALVLAETPSNPGLHILDLRALASRCREAGARLAVDNTFATGLLQRPLELGADLAMASDTKATGGHSDLILGHVACRDDALMSRIEAIRKFAGAIPGPFEAWMLNRSLDTLELRLTRMCANAAAAADFLAAHPAVSDVTYPGRPDHPGHALAAGQMHAPGFIVGLTLADIAAADRFVAAAAVLPATSFGGTHTSADRRARFGDAVPDGYLRLSLGIEPTDTLLAALRKGLDAI